MLPETGGNNCMKIPGYVLISAALLLAGGCIALAVYLKPEGRYQFQVSAPPGVMWVLDTRSGQLVDLRSSDFTRQGTPVKIFPKPVR